jgi:hypothetical protein
MNSQGAPFDLEITTTVLKRIAGIYNGIAEKVLVTVNYNRLTDLIENHADGRLELRIKHCRRPIVEHSLWLEGTSEHVYMAAMTFSSCINAISLCSGILASLIKGIWTKRVPQS